MDRFGHMRSARQYGTQTGRQYTGRQILSCGSSVCKSWV